MIATLCKALLVPLYYVFIAVVVAVLLITLPFAPEHVGDEECGL